MDASKSAFLQIRLTAYSSSLHIMVLYKHSLKVKKKPQTNKQRKLGFAMKQVNSHIWLRPQDFLYLWNLLTWITESRKLVTTKFIGIFWGFFFNSPYFRADIFDVFTLQNKFKFLLMLIKICNISSSEIIYIIIICENGKL